MRLELSDADIELAERILFGRVNVFDSERRAFIRNFDTLDVLAVPGSGKTTALLAKLILLSRYQEIPSQKGILVLSHTNAAVDLIREKIGGYCPNLFRYPNFIGTIQKFVDTFLAVPYYESKYGFRPEHIDAELYNVKIQKAFESFFTPSGFRQPEIKNARWYVMANELISSYRLALRDTGIEVIDSLNGKALSLAKPRRGFQKNYVDFTSQEKEKIKEWLIQYKIHFWRSYRIIHYDDAYFLADMYEKRYPSISRILQERFDHVFVDEMQDMDAHQISVLDKMFHSQLSDVLTFQRIGDKNQSIFSYDVKLEDVWVPRPIVLTLEKSMRLSKLTAERVQPFALNAIQLIGSNDETNRKEIKPRIIVYHNDNITQVLRKFAEIIKQLQIAGDLPENPKDKFWAIGWRKVSDEDRKTVLKHYFPSFTTDRAGSTTDTSACLRDYLNVHTAAGKSDALIDSILAALLAIIDIEKIELNGITLTKPKLVNYLKKERKTFYPEFRLLVFKVMKAVITNLMSEAQSIFKDLARKVIQNISANSTLSIASVEFIDRDAQQVSNEDNFRENVYELEDIRIHIGTVHSVKGETHCATLYLETFFQADGLKSFESQRLIDQLKGVQIKKSAGKRTQQSSRIVYVGFSRPTHLLCLAAREDRIVGHEEELTRAGWILERV